MSLGASLFILFCYLFVWMGAWALLAWLCGKIRFPGFLRHFVGGLFGLIFSLFAVGYFVPDGAMALANDSTSSDTEPAPIQSSASASAPAPVRWELLDSKVEDLPVGLRVDAKILVNGNLSAESVEGALRECYEKLKVSLENRGQLSEQTWISAFAGRQGAMEGWGNGFIGMLSISSTKEIVIKIERSLLIEIAHPITTIHGLTYAQCGSLYRDYRTKLIDIRSWYMENRTPENDARLMKVKWSKEVALGKEMAKAAKLTEPQWSEIKGEGDLRGW